MKKQTILIEFSNNVIHQHTRDCMLGIHDYAVCHCIDWEFLTDPFDIFLAFQPGGVLLKGVTAAFVWAFEPSATTEFLSKMRIPTINLTRPDAELPFPCVSLNFPAFGELAAKHLNQPQIASHLYVGPGYHRSLLLCEGFKEGLRSLGRAEPAVHMEDARFEKGSNIKRLAQLKRLIRSSHRPGERLGVFAFSDSLGAAVIKVAIELGLRVPNDIAVLGTGCETLACEFSPVPLSSISIRSRAMGFESARLLDSLIRGVEVPAISSIDPDSLVERRSSSHLAVDDPVVAKALQIMQEHATRGLRVKEMIDWLPVQRRTFEKRFLKEVGRTPHEEIARIRIERALQMLAEDKDTNAKIACLCGFGSETHFEHVMVQHTGHPPSFFRGNKRRTTKQINI